MLSIAKSNRTHAAWRAFGIAALVFCAATPNAALAEDSVRVRIVDLAFVPNVIHVKPGQKIIWTNEDQVAHTVTSGKTTDEGVWPTSEPLAQGQSFEIGLRKPGDYAYYCKPHFYNPAMHAHIIVDAGPVARRQPTHERSSI